MSLEQAIEISIIIAGAIGTIIGVIKDKKNSKKTKKLENVVTFAQIVQQLPEIICEVEKLLPSTDSVKYGTQKLALALNKVEMICLKSNVTFDKSAFTFEIEKILSTPQKGDEKHENESSK